MNQKKLKAKVEALLFLNSKQLSAAELARQANADIDDVRAALSQLVQDYESREDSGLIIDTLDGYSMQVRDDYEDLSQDILEIELKTGCLRTLSVIALKDPAYQADIVQMRGGGAYEHIKELQEMGLIKRKREAHKNVLVTTKMFHDFFKLTDNGIELKDLLKKDSSQVRFSRGMDSDLAEMRAEATENHDEEASESSFDTESQNQVRMSSESSATDLSAQIKMANIASDIAQELAKQQVNEEQSSETTNV